MGVGSSQPKGVLKILPAEIGLLRENQCHPVTRLRLDNVGQLRRGELEVIQGAGTELRCRGLVVGSFRSGGVHLTAIARGHRDEPGLFEFDRPLE